LGHGSAVDCARKVVAGLAAAGVLHGDERVWDASTFSKNRDRLLKKKMAKRFFQEVLKQARERNLLSDEHFTVDGTLIEAWASLKSFQRKEQEKQENGDEENVVDAACGPE
jgi:transposase